MLSKYTYMYLIVNLGLTTSVFSVGNFFLIAPFFSDCCLLVHLSDVLSDKNDHDLSKQNALVETNIGKVMKQYARIK